MQSAIMRLGSFPLQNAPVYRRGVNHCPGRCALFDNLVCAFSSKPQAVCRFDCFSGRQGKHPESTGRAHEAKREIVGAEEGDNRLLRGRGWPGPVAACRGGVATVYEIQNPKKDGGFPSQKFACGTSAPTCSDSSIGILKYLTRYFGGVLHADVYV